MVNHDPGDKLGDHPAELTHAEVLKVVHTTDIKEGREAAKEDDTHSIGLTEPHTEFGAKTVIVQVGRDGVGHWVKIDLSTGEEKEDVEAPQRERNVVTASK